MGPVAPVVPGTSDIEERSNGRYVREMIFEGAFISFMILIALATTYFAVYYLGWGDVMQKHNIDYLHQWAAHFPGWMESTAAWVKGVLGMA